MSAGLFLLVATQLTDEDPEDFDAILHFSVIPMGKMSPEPLKAAPQYCNIGRLFAVILTDLRRAERALEYMLNGGII